jgi:hypothetical protein
VLDLPDPDPYQGWRVLDNGGTLVNNGTVDWTGTGYVIQDSSGGSINNYGLFDAQGDGQLEPSNEPANSFVFTNYAGATFEKSGTSSGGSGVTYVGAEFDNSGGSVQVDAGTMQLAGGGTSSGTFTVAGGASLNFSADYALTGALSVTGSGTVEVSGGTLSLGASTISVGGVLQIDSGAEVSGSGTVDITAGTVTLAGGTLSAGTLVQVDSGVELSGFGTLDGSVENAGTIAVGGASTVGTISITGNYTQTSTGVLDLALKEVSGNQYDQLNITGTAALDGTVNVTVLSGFFASGGDEFDALTFSSGSGGFASTNLPTLSGGLSLNAAYKSADWALIVQS